MKCQRAYLPIDRRPTPLTMLALAMSASMLHASSSHAADLSISSTVNGSTATLTVSDSYGGAITSFTYRGQQYINIADLGREMQSSVAFDSYGECYNPNEAGNNLGTPSQLLSWSNADGVLTTSTNMAFWLAPGQNGVCGNGATHAVNTTVHSGLIFEKSVRFGSDGVPNVLDYRVKYHLNENRSYGIFEALTGYLPYTFFVWFTFDPQTSTVSRLEGFTNCYGDTDCIYQNRPIIASLGYSHAMGIYAPIPPDGAYGAHTNINVFNNPFIKWNAVYTQAPVTAGTVFERQLKVPFGTVDEIITAMRSITGVSLPLKPILRFFGNNDHFLVSQFADVTSSAYSFERTAFRVYETPQDSGMIPLYRCYYAAAVDHFVSAQSNCEGRTYEGTYGYVSSYARPGYEAIYRFYRTNISDHLTTTDYNEGVSAGYTYEGVLGYAPTTNY